MTVETVKQRIDKRNWKPRSAVWEFTLACNLRCGHCGSRAGRSLPDELDTKECCDLVSELFDLGCELITLSGGEPTLRDDWDIIARDIHQKGMYVNMVTNGVYGKAVSARAIARRALDAGMCNVGVSIDGPKEIHDRIRGSGTFEKTTQSIRAFVNAGLSTTVMTTVNKLNVNHLEDIRRLALGLGARAVRYQLAKPMGTMDDHRDWVLPPGAIATLLPKLAAMKQAGGIDIRVGDSLGYYGKPDKILRAWSWKRKRSRWGGCQAGLQAIGIQANGDIKGCLSMQAERGDTDPFVEGNIRKMSLADIWYKEGAFAYNRDFSLDQLTHDCRQCKQAALCRGGARCISSAMDGTVTHDDYCYYRLLPEHDQLTWTTVSKSAAAAALALSINTAACSDEDNPIPVYGLNPDASAETDSSSDTDTDTDTQTSVQDTDTETASETSDDTGHDTDALDYAVEPDYAVQPEYAVEPDTHSDAETDTENDTGSDTASDYNTDTTTDDATDHDTDSAIDTESVSDTASEDSDSGTDTGAGTDSDTGIDTNMMDYAVEPDYMVMPEYAVEPDTDSDTSLRKDTDTWYEMDYAVTADYTVYPDKK